MSTDAMHDDGQTATMYSSYCKVLAHTVGNDICSSLAYG